MEIKKRPPSTGGSNTSENSVFQTVDPILCQLQEEKEKFEKTIVYVPLKWCGQLHYRAETVFKLNAESATKESKNITTLVSQYHSPQSQQVSYYTFNSIKLPCRILMKFNLVFDEKI